MGVMGQQDRGAVFFAAELLRTSWRDIERRDDVESK
jgi:hypothetical protein